MKNIQNHGVLPLRSCQYNYSMYIQIIVHIINIYSSHVVLLPFYSYKTLIYQSTENTIILYLLQLHKNKINVVLSYSCILCVQLFYNNAFIVQ